MLAFVSSAQAKTRTGTYSTSTGKSGTLAETTTRAPGKVDRTVSATNQAGLTTTSNSERTFNPAAGTGTYSRTTTAPSGKTATVNNSSSTNPDGTISTTGTRTGFNGKTDSLAATTTKTDSGSTTAGTITGPNGKTASLSTVVTKEPDGIGRDTTITGANGQVLTRDEYTQKNTDGSLTRTIETIKPDGATSTRTENLSAPLPPTN